ncbi:MAG: glucosaminidase domain-containing protein [Ginsengibacter sp.]
MKKTCLILFSFLISALLVKSQRLSQEEYIAKYKDLAIFEMKRSGVPASITLAQGMIETEYGNSPLVLRSNNHFGIKCKSNWSGPSVSHDDDEKDECFRAYGSAEESYKDHSDFLRTNSRYAFLFDLEPTNYKEWATGLQKAGYATNPRYPEMLIRYIETHHLQKFDTAEFLLASDIDQEPSYEVFQVKAIENIPVQPVPNKSTPSWIPFSQHVVNGSKAVFVPEGTSLLAFATKQKIHLSKLLAMNDLKKDGLLEKSQFIFLEKKSAEGQQDFYIVEAGETIFDVAQKNGILLQSLLTFNGLQENDPLYAGKKLHLKKPSATASSAARPQVYNTSKSDEISKHKVEPKEGLYAISKKYGVSIDQIKNWNNLSDDTLKIGQELIISK